MRAPRARAYSYSSSTSTPAPSLNTKPSRSRSHGRDARAGSSLRVDIAFIAQKPPIAVGDEPRSEEHTSELQSLMRSSYAVFCLKKKNKSHNMSNSHNPYTNLRTHCA